MKIKPITTAAALLLALTSTAAFAEPLDEDKRAECINAGLFPLCETVYGVLDDDFSSRDGNELTKPGLIHLVDDLEKEVYGYVDENDEEVPGLVDAVADLDLRASQLENNQEDLEDVIFGNGKQGNEKKTGLVETLDDLVGKINSHSEAITDYGNVLETLHNDVVSLDDNKADKVELDKKADKVALADKADKSQLATFQQQLDTKLSQADVDGKADKTELDKKADKADVIANKGAIAGLNNNVAANAAAINALNSSKLDKATFETLNTDFNKLQTAVSKLGTQVDANTARLGQLDRRVTKVQKEVRRGLATQSALAGLFQPYNVGKVNVTAAVGGYKSNTALAVGAGYRFNENVAAKAGVAVSTSGGGLSYNVGVNYEF